MKDSIGETTKVELAMNKFRLKKRAVPALQRGKLLKQCPHTNKDDRFKVDLDNEGDYVMLLPIIEKN